MKKLLKWIGIVLLILAIVAFSGAYYLTTKADTLMAAKFEVKPPTFEIPSDSLSLLNGKKLAGLCTECHGKNFEGYAFFNDPKLGKIYGPNLTKGKGSATSYYSDMDWIRAIRHGVRPNGDGLVIMPAQDYYALSKTDLASIIAYMKTIEPVDNVTEKNHLTTLGKILLAVGAFGEVHAAKTLDHTKPPIENAPTAGANVEYGEYLVQISGCKTCHGPQLNGGKHPDPNSPLVPNLTPKGNLNNWSKEHFITAFRTGKTPEGKTLNVKYMPYTAFNTLSEDDITAVYLYLKTLPAVDTPK